MRRVQTAVHRVGLQLNALQRDGKIERVSKGKALRWRLLPSY
jgi:hypothetical protein